MISCVYWPIELCLLLIVPLWLMMWLNVNLYIRISPEPRPLSVCSVLSKCILSKIHYISQDTHSPKRPGLLSLSLPRKRVKYLNQGAGGSKR